MSVKVMGKVWDTALPPNQKLVLLAYADAAEHDGTEIWPGHEAVETMTSYSQPNVAKITRELLALGVLIRVSRGRKGRRAAYRIDLSHPVFAYQDDIQSLPLSVSPDPPQGITGDTPPVLSTAVLSKKGDKSPRVLLKNAIAEWWTGTGPPHSFTKSEWGRVERAAKELETIGATGQDVKQRGAQWWPKMEKSPQGLVQNWTRLAGDRKHECVFIANGAWGSGCFGPDGCGARQPETDVV